MRAVVLLLMIACLSMLSPVRASADAPRQQIHLSTYEIMRSIEAQPTRDPFDLERLLDQVVDYLENKTVGVGPLFTLLPAEAPEVGEVAEIEPPRFAFVARMSGRTLVSVTKFGSTADEEDRVLHQRWLISDLMKSQRYTVTVYKEHTIHKSALRFLGVGARLMLRPDIEVAGWRFGFEMYGSYHPDHQATAYLALTGKTISPAPAPLSSTASLAARQRGVLIPLKW